MKIQFVLVEPKVPENIGASARALKTMGFDTLLLVNSCEWKDGKSRWVAHGSADVLDNAIEYRTLEEALRGSDFSVATSAKKRTVKQDYVLVSQLGSLLGIKLKSAGTLSIVFGREESGLTNDEMKLCDITSTIPIISPYPSLNLSQAVMIYAYELAGLGKAEIKKEKTNDYKSFSRLKLKTKNILSRIGLDENDSRFGRIMERIAFIGDDDVNLLHSLISLLSEKLDGRE